jgi:cobalt-zinc-cadmium efflux system outer membrane protein
MVGVRLNVPIRTGRRDAAVADARTRLAQRRAELAKAVDQAALQVQEAYEQVREVERALKLYEESALPAARESVRLAQSSYTTGKVPFLTLPAADQPTVKAPGR